MGEAASYLHEVVLTHKRKKQCLFWPFSRNARGAGQVRYKGRPQIVCRVVCRKLHGKPPTAMHEACHSCGNGHLGCVNPWHLYWGTHKQNMDDMLDHGTVRQGVMITHAKLTDKLVQRILARIDMGEGNRKIAREFRVHSTTISKIRSGKTWKHINR